MNGQIHGGRSNLNVIAFAQLPKSLSINKAAGFSPLFGIDDIAQCELDVVVRHFDIDVGLYLKTLHHEVTLHFLNLLLRAFQEFLRVLASYAFQDVGKRLYIARIGDRNANFIPDVTKSARVVEDWCAKNLRVCELDSASAVLISADPVADLHHARIEEADIDHISAEFVDLDAVASRIHVSGKDGDATGDAEKRLAQGDCESSSDEPPELALVLEDLRPEGDDRCHREHRDHGVGETI